MNMLDLPHLKISSGLQNGGWITHLFRTNTADPHGGGLVLPLKLKRKGKFVSSDKHKTQSMVKKNYSW